jgi:hypothetical protein
MYMRILIVLAFLLPLTGRTQDCKLLRDTDPYTKETRISSGFLTLQGGTLSIDADSREVDFFFVIPGKCFNDQSTVFVFFEGTKAKATYRSANSMNCDGYFHFTFKNGANTPLPVQKLGTIKVTQFIFTDTDKKQVVVSLLPEHQDTFMTAVNCVVNESKKLIR